MAEDDEPDDNRLAGRVPKGPRPDVVDDEAEGVDESVVAGDQQIDTVNRLMGFLRDADHD